MNMNMRTNSISAVAMAVLLAAAANAGAQGSTTAQTTNNSQASQKSVSPSDKMFLTKAAEGGQAEVALATMAQQKAASPKVKQLAERIETDHKKANTELMSIITAKGVSAPAGTDKEHDALRARLEKLQGSAFDQAYATAMVNDHTKDIKEFETAARSTDPQVKDFAQKTLPTLREHLKMAQDAQGTAH